MSTLWTALMIPSARVFNPSDAGTVTVESGRVSQLTDQKGSGLAFSQSLAANRPEIAPSVINGKDVLRFDGNSRKMNFPVNIANTIDSKLNLYIVAKNNGGTRGALIGTRPASEQQGWSFRYNSATELLYYMTGASPTLSKSISAGEWIITSVHRDGLSVAIGLNGTIDAPTSISGFNPSTITPTLGIETGGTSNPLNADIARLVWVEDDVDQETHDKIVGSLAHELGLTGLLPAEHPYKIAAPAYGVFHGTVIDKDGNPAERRISVLDATGHCVATDTSDPVTGAYSIDMPNDDPYTLVFDGEPDRNAIVYANVIPGESPA